MSVSSLRSLRMLLDLGLRPERGDLNRKRNRNSGDVAVFRILRVLAGTGVFDGVVWPATTALGFGGAVCAPKA